MVVFVKHDFRVYRALMLGQQGKSLFFTEPITLG